MCRYERRKAAAAGSAGRRTAGPGRSPSFGRTGAGPGRRRGAGRGRSWPPEPTLEELLAQLDELCGLDRVKKDVKSLINLVKVRKLRATVVLPVPGLPMNTRCRDMGGTGRPASSRSLRTFTRLAQAAPQKAGPAAPKGEDKPPEEPEPTLEELLAQLDELCGLHSVVLAQVLEEGGGLEEVEVGHPGGHLPVQGGGDLMAGGVDGVVELHMPGGDGAGAVRLPHPQGVLAEVAVRDQKSVVQP